MPTLTLSPTVGSLVLRTGVEGRAARLGHRLHLLVTAWECLAEVDGAEPASIELRAQLPSLEVVSGDGGLKPLSDKDRRTIKDNALSTLLADRHPEVRFVSSTVQPALRGWSVTGALTVAGVTAPVDVGVTTAPEKDGLRLTGRATVSQSTHRIRPYSTMLGTLQVSDRVGIELQAVVPRD